MHTSRAAVTAAAFTIALGGSLFLSAAGAAPASALSPNCDTVYNNNQGDGYVRAFLDRNCDNLLGKALGDDGDWSNQSGPFQAGDNDDASSLVNTGTFAGGVNDVQFYRDAGFTGGTGCLNWNELYVDDLSDNVFSNGVGANDRISSHRWVDGCTNPWT